MQIVDLFSGCGGLSHGAKLAGIETALAIEADVAAASSYAANNIGATVLNCKVENITVEDLSLPKVDLILSGGPPCQGFSSSNQKNRQIDSKRNRLYEEMLRLSDGLDPEIFLFENVYGIVEGEKRNILESLIRELKKRFLTVDWSILNAAQYGVPQIRRRVFIVAHRRSGKIRWPAPNTEIQTVRDSFSDLPALKNGADTDVMPYRCPPKSQYAENLRGGLHNSTGHLVTNNAELILNRYKYIPQGGNWRDIPDSLMTNYADRQRCHTGIYRRLSSDGPSVVIGNFRKNMLIHPTEDRGLSIREAARLQSFPDKFIFHGSIGKRQQQVGNAVPPLLAAAVLRSVVGI